MHRFIVGQTYENRKGSFKVLSISGIQMRIVFDNGEQVNTSTVDQERILSNIDREQKVEAKFFQPRSSTRTSRYPNWYGSTFNGFLDSDFSEDVTGTHWRCREQLGGAVTARIKSDRQYNSWSIYGWAHVHWAEVNHRGKEDQHVQSKFLVKLNSTELSFGLYIERSNQENAPRKDWNQLLHWMQEPNNCKFLHQLMIDKGLSIWDPWYSGDVSQSLSLSIYPNNYGFEIRRESEVIDTIPLLNLAEALEKIAQDRPDLWINILFGTRIGKAEALAEKSGIATRIAEVFNLLLPLYENRDP